MAPQRGRRRLASLTIFVLAALTLLAIGGPLRRVGSSVARTVVAPFVDVVSAVTKPIGETIAGAFNYSNVVDQNHVLERELARLRLQSEQGAFEDQQLEDLLALRRLPFVGSLPVATAQLNAQNLSNFTATVQIDKGSSAGILVGMPVVGGGGLVGIVSATTSGGSTVTLLTDSSTSVGVTFGGGRFVAVLHGQGVGRNLAANFVAPGTPVHYGETLFTSGLQGGEYPPGIPVAKIVTTTSRRGATQLSVSAQPLADLQDLAYVDVVLWAPGT